MAHTRIRSFNTREMYPDKEMDNDLCMAVRAGNRFVRADKPGRRLPRRWRSR